MCHVSDKIVSMIKRQLQTVKLTPVFSRGFHTKTSEAYGKIRGKPNQPCNYLNRGHKSKVNICGQYNGDDDESNVGTRTDTIAVYTLQQSDYTLPIFQHTHLFIAIYHIHYDVTPFETCMSI